MKSLARLLCSCVSNTMPQIRRRLSGNTGRRRTRLDCRCRLQIIIKVSSKISMMPFSPTSASQDRPKKFKVGKRIGVLLRELSQVQQSYSTKASLFPTRQETTWKILKMPYFSRTPLPNCPNSALTPNNRPNTTIISIIIIINCKTLIHRPQHTTIKTTVRTTCCC